MSAFSGKYAPLAFLLSGFAFIYLVIQWQYGVFGQAYFWDELGVYSRASLHLYDNGLSLLPSSIPDELSRGHPLFCSFYFALAFKLFGPAPITAHFAAACINMLGFFFCYRILNKYISPWKAAAGTMAIFVQPLFLSQSVLVLPEMPLMVSTLGAVMYYLYDKKWGVMLCLIISLQIKESALVLPIAFFIADISVNRKLTIRNIVFFLLIPVASFIVFICIQKYQRGYYFYPLHTSLSSFDMYFIRERWENFKHYFIHEQGHYITWIITCILSGIFILKHAKNPNPVLKNRVVVLLLIIAGGLGFLVLNYYLSRYTMYFTILYFIIVILLIVIILERYLYLQYALMLLIMTTGVYHWNNKQVYTDVDFSYADHIRALQLTLEELENEQYRDKTVGMDFPLAAAYWSDRNGYNKPAGVHSAVLKDSLPPKDFMVFTHPGNMGDTALLSKVISLEKEVRSAYAYSRIYRVKRQ